MNDLSNPDPIAADAPERPLPASLRRNAPLVPVDSAGGRALAAVIAILTFLAALCAGGADLVATSSGEWRSAVAREVTIQVRPHPQRDIEADVARAAELARRDPARRARRSPSRASSPSACSSPGSGPGSISATCRCRGSS